MKGGDFMAKHAWKNIPMAILISLLLVSPAWAPVRQGDVTGDGYVDLQDAILALQVAAGSNASLQVILSGDVNANGKIGIEEAVYVLQEVAHVRNRPTLDPIGNKTVEESSTLAFSVSATDPEGEALTFAAMNMPDGAAFDGAARAFSWTPTYSQSGTYQVTFVATDIRGFSDSQQVTIAVLDRTPLFRIPDYFPLEVGNWWDYEVPATGQTYRTSVVDTKTIRGVLTWVLLYADGTKEFYTSGSNGMALYGTYIETPEYTGDIIFDRDLLLIHNNAALMEGLNGSTSYVLTLFVPEQGYVTVNIDVISMSKVLALDYVHTRNKTLRDCLKVSLEQTHTIRETGQAIVETIYYWCYKGVGVVKQETEGQILTIKASHVNGVTENY